MSRLASKGQLRASFIRWALFAVPICILLGFLSSQIGSPSSLWFEQLQKPPYQPPASLFSIVWLVLYTMIGLALALVCAAWGARGRTMALVLFTLHFAFNLSWSPVFFGSYQLTGGLVVLLLADVTLLATIVAFWRVRPLAGILLLPYLAWSLFATLLNWQLLQLNPESDGVDPTQAVQKIEI